VQVLKVSTQRNLIGISTAVLLFLSAYSHISDAKAEQFNAELFRDKAVEINNDPDIAVNLERENVMSATFNLPLPAYITQATFIGSIQSAAFGRWILCDDYNVRDVLHGKSAIIIQIKSAGRPIARIDTFTNCNNSYEQLSGQQITSLESFTRLAGDVYSAAFSCPNWVLTQKEDDLLRFAFEQWLNARMRASIKRGIQIFNSTTNPCQNRRFQKLRTEFNNSNSIERIRRIVGSD